MKTRVSHLKVGHWFTKILVSSSKTNRLLNRLRADTYIYFFNAEILTVFVNVMVISQAYGFIKQFHL